MADWGGAAMAGSQVAGSIIGGLFGGDDGSEAAADAARAQADAQRYAADLQNLQITKTRQDLHPYLWSGYGALGKYNAALGIPGWWPGADKEAQNPNAATENLRATPGYQWRMDQGLEALNRKAANRGLLNSGSQSKALMTYGQGLADQTYQQYMQNLWQLAGSGQNAANLQGSLGGQAALNQGNFIAGAGNAQAQGIMNAYQARQSGYNNQANALGMGIGALGRGLGYLYNNYGNSFGGSDIQYPDYSYEWQS